MADTHFSGQVVAAGSPAASAFLTRGEVFWVDAVHGSDSGTGTATSPLSTLLAAYNRCESGRGDVIVIQSYDGTTTGTARVAAGGFTWAKSGITVIGNCAPTQVAKRARIAAATGATAVTTPTLFTISGANNAFYNLHFFHGVDGAADSFCMKITGQRNYFEGCHIAGLGHATAAARAGSRTLTIDGGAGTFLGENTFRDCLFGVATIPQAAANAQVEFLQFTSRNHFINCKFIGSCPTGTATGLFVKAGASTIQDYVIFEDCLFASLTKQSGTTTRTNAMNIDTGSGGEVYLLGSTMVAGCTDVDAASSSNVWGVGAVPTAATSHVAIVLTH